MVKWMRLFIGVFATVSLFGCGPPYPDDENHSGVSNADCIDCHVDGAEPDAPRLPGKHWDGKKLDWDNCKHCHQKD